MTLWLLFVAIKKQQVPFRHCIVVVDIVVDGYFQHILEFSLCHIPLASNVIEITIRMLNIRKSVIFEYSVQLRQKHLFSVVESTYL